MKQIIPLLLVVGACVYAGGPEDGKSLSEQIERDGMVTLDKDGYEVRVDNPHLFLRSNDGDVHGVVVHTADPDPLHYELKPDEVCSFLMSYCESYWLQDGVLHINYETIHEKDDSFLPHDEYSQFSLVDSADVTPDYGMLCMPVGDICSSIWRGIVGCARSWRDASRQDAADHLPDTLVSSERKEE